MYNPPDPRAFNKRVWLIVRQVPAGQVTTYGQIASMIPPPEGIEPPTYDRLGPRWVGTAMNQCPDDVPWQRVINSKGAISLPKGSLTAIRQRVLLEAEGIVFDARGRVDFNAVGWDGPNTVWRKAHGLLPPRSLKSDSADDTTQLSLF